MKRLASRRRPGFSLLELMVALAVGGMAVAAAAGLLTGLSSRAGAIEAVAASADRDANGERMLRLLTGNLDASVDSTGLEGDGESVTFRTWCEAVSGWSEPCRVRLAFRVERGSRSLLMQRLDLVSERTTVFDEPSIVLRGGLRSGRFLYLLDASNGGSWSETWTTITLPAAIAAVLEEDTLILPLR